MSAARKLWMTDWPEITLLDPRDRHTSKAATYRFVDRQAQARRRGERASNRVDVYVDEQDGRGWQLYERVDLDTLGGAS
jgi:hypothetical protein